MRNTLRELYEKIMSEYKEGGVDPEIAKKINEEGFEGNVALLLGKKEDKLQLEARLEKEGRAEDLGSYIWMHKSITVPKEEIDKDKINETHKGQSDLYWRIHDRPTLYFIDKEGNIAEVLIDPTKISSMLSAIFKKGSSIIIDHPIFAKQLEKELEELHFKKNG